MISRRQNAPRSHPEFNIEEHTHARRAALSSRPLRGFLFSLAFVKTRFAQPITFPLQTRGADQQVACFTCTTLPQEIYKFRDEMNLLSRLKDRSTFDQFSIAPDMLKLARRPTRNASASVLHAAAIYSPRVLSLQRRLTMEKLCGGYFCHQLSLISRCFEMNGVYSRTQRLMIMRMKCKRRSCGKSDEEGKCNCRHTIDSP